jgi:hypothetical protein
MGMKIRALCDLSGRLVEVELGDEPVEPQDLVPDGWLRIDITRPLPSLANAQTLVAKANLVEGMLAEQRRGGVPESQIQQILMPIVTKTADATFAALESMTPVREVARVSILVANPDDGRTEVQVIELLHQLAAVLSPVAGNILEQLGVQAKPPPKLVPAPTATPDPPALAPAAGS